jgi:LEA14-like dessication related protein
MKNRASIFKSVYFAAAVVSCFAFTACETLKSMVKVAEPKVSLKTVDITNVSFSGLDLLCNINVENPNAIDIPFPELAWKLFINANEFVAGTVPNGNPLKAGSATTVEIPVSLKYIEVLNTVKSLVGAAEAAYKIAVDLKFALPIIGDKVVHLEHEGTIPLLQAPFVGFKGIKITNSSLAKVDFEVNWEIEKKNGVAMLVNDFSYSLKVNNSQWTAGSVPKNLQIAPKQKQAVAFSGSLSGVAVVASIADILLKGNDVMCVCDGNLNIGFDFPGFKNFAFPFNYSGTTKLQK